MRHSASLYRYGLRPWLTVLLLFAAVPVHATFTEHGDGTVSDTLTGLMWDKCSSGQSGSACASGSASAHTWEQAQGVAASTRGTAYKGYNDWRLPNAKELQSLVDYGHAPDATDRAKQAPALNPVFKMGDPEAWYWTGTTHLENRSCGFAVYVCFGKAMGSMHGEKMNVHGAGAQRSDPKAGNPADWKEGNGPQGDEVRILNYVRCVRGGGVTRKADGPALDGTYTAGRSRPAPGGGGGRDARPGFIAHLDKDGDGKVSRQEFDGPPDRFGDFDKDGDGYISAGEAPQGPPPGRGGRQP